MQPYHDDEIVVVTKILVIQKYTDEQWIMVIMQVVYVGSAVAMTTKVLLPPLLRAAINDSGLVLYGHGWADVDEFKQFWQGVLPQVRFMEKRSTLKIVCLLYLKS